MQSKLKQLSSWKGVQFLRRGVLDRLFLKLIRITGFHLLSLCILHFEITLSDQSDRSDNIRVMVASPGYYVPLHRLDPRVPPVSVLLSSTVKLAPFQSKSCSALSGGARGSLGE